MQRLWSQLAALGVGLGACHTEYVVQDGRARLVEVTWGEASPQQEAGIRIEPPESVPSAASARPADAPSSMRVSRPG